MAEKDHQTCAMAIHNAIMDTPKKKKQILLKTLLRHFGFKTRQKHWLATIQESLAAANVTVMPTLMNVGRDEWVTLTVIEPSLPQAETSSECTKKIDPWFNEIGGRTFRSEKEVEIRFVIPLLERLGYNEEDRSDGYPVEQVTGVRKVKTEADFVLFNGANRSQDNALLVVEAKNLGKNLQDHIGQAKSYAMFLGTPYFLVTNGDEIRVCLYRSPIESHIEVFKATRLELPSTFPSLYNLVSKEAIIEYKRRKRAG